MEGIITSIRLMFVAIILFWACGCDMLWHSRLDRTEAELVNLSQRFDKHLAGLDANFETAVTVHGNFSEQTVCQSLQMRLAEMEAKIAEFEERPARVIIRPLFISVPDNHLDFGEVELTRGKGDTSIHLCHSEPIPVKLRVSSEFSLPYGRVTLLDDEVIAQPKQKIPLRLFFQAIPGSRRIEGKIIFRAKDPNLFCHPVEIRLSGRVVETESVGSFSSPLILSTRPPGAAVYLEQRNNPSSKKRSYVADSPVHLAVEPGDEFIVTLMPPAGGSAGHWLFPMGRQLPVSTNDHKRLPMRFVFQVPRDQSTLIEALWIHPGKSPLDQQIEATADMSLRFNVDQRQFEVFATKKFATRHISLSDDDLARFFKVVEKIGFGGYSYADGNRWVVLYVTSIPGQLFLATDFDLALCRQESQAVREVPENWSTTNAK